MKMNDRELLELAAKAAGIEVDGAMRQLWGFEGSSAWNPIARDDDAFLLAVDLGMTVSVRTDKGKTRILNDDKSLLLVHMHFDGGPRAATRRAIVRAAAEIGRQMQEGGTA